MSFVGLYTLIWISISTIDVIIIPQLSSIAYSIHMGITLFQFIIGSLNINYFTYFIVEYIVHCITKYHNDNFSH